MAWRRSGNKPLSEPMMVSSLTHICITWPQWVNYNGIIISTMVSQITSLLIIYSTIYSGADQRKHQSSTSLALCVGNALVICEFPAQRANYAENATIWSCHDVQSRFCSHSLFLPQPCMCECVWFVLCRQLRPILPPPPPPPPPPPHTHTHTHPHTPHPTPHPTPPSASACIHSMHVWT